MRTLLYVPVIHTSADLGSFAGEVHDKGAASLGDDFWKIHTGIIDCFWNVVINFFSGMDVTGVRIYQDGMVVGADLGEKIIEEGAKLGSKNYKLVADLIKRGAVIEQTENIILVKKEHTCLVAMMQARSFCRKLFTFVRYKLSKKKILRERDRFIAQRIDDTLEADGKGILFVGAYHDVKELLAADIKVIEIKDVKKVREYQRLVPFRNKYAERVDALSKYLVEDIRTDPA